MRWLSVLLLGASMAAHAEPVTLEQAIEMALHSDPRIKEREHLVEVARTLLQEATGSDDLLYSANAFVGLAPSIDGGFYKDGQDSCTGSCQPRSDVRDIDGVTPWTNLQFSIIKPLYTFGKISNYAEAAQGNIEVKEGDVALRRMQTVLDVTRAYNGFLAARDTRLLLEDVQRRVEQAITLVENWLENGKGNARQSDLFALQTGKAVVDSYLAKARAIENVALDGLKVLTGVGMGNELEVAERGSRPVELPPGTLQELQERALANRPEMAQVEAGLRARRALVEAKKADRMPNVYAGLVGSLAYSPDRARLNNPHVHDPFNHEGATPVLGIKWDYSSGVHPARVARAQAELEALLEVSAFARQGIPFEVAEHYHQVHAHHEMVQTLTQGSRAGRRWMISTYADFEAGLETADKVITAFQGYVLAHSDYLRVVNDYNVLVAKLRAVTGELK